MATFAASGRGVTTTFRGARPKASVRDGDRLLIAKFASPGDEWDVIGWEKTALDLAERAGVRVPPRRLRRINRKAVLLLDRFDRADDGERIPYVSAMTLMSARDGDTGDYVEIAEALSEHGDVTVRADLAQLWRRVAFSVAVHNTDDHLRNHGFLRGTAGWRLSPLFDVNPEPDPARERVTGISAAHGRADEVEGLRASAGAFGLSAAQAEQILAEVSAATRGWRAVAAENGISERGQTHMAAAFDAFGS